VCTRAAALANRIEQGASMLIRFVENLSEAEWQTIVLNENRTVGVLVHHVATVYPAEINLARRVAAGESIVGSTWEAVDAKNAQHAREHPVVDQGETLELLRRNSRWAADAVRQFSDKELDRAAAVSLYAGAPLTAQFLIEDHALRPVNRAPRRKPESFGPRLPPTQHRMPRGTPHRSPWTRSSTPSKRGWPCPPSTKQRHVHPLLHPLPRQLNP